MTKEEFQNKYSPKNDEITINGVTISYDCYEIDVEDGKDVVCFYNEGGYCFMCSIPLEDVDLINRQQAEIEDLKEDNFIKSQKRANIFEILNAHEKGRAEAIKEFVNSATDLCYKEFGSELEVAHTFAAILTRTLDSFEKEMVGEQE